MRKQRGQLVGPSTFLYLYFNPTVSSSAGVDAMIALAHWMLFGQSCVRNHPVLQLKILQISLFFPTHIGLTMSTWTIKINYAVSFDNSWK